MPIVPLPSVEALIDCITLKDVLTRSGIEIAREVQVTGIDTVSSLEQVRFRSGVA